MADIATTILIYICAFGIVLLALFLNRVTRSWSAAPTFFLMIWCVYICAPLILSPHFYISLQTMLWLLAMSAFWTMGTLLGFGIRLGPTNNIGAVKLTHLFAARRVGTFVILGAIMGFAAIVSSVRGSSSISISSSLLLSIEEMARTNATGRYSGGFNPTALQNFLLSVTYFSTILGGLFFASLKQAGRNRKIDILISISPILILALFGVIQNTKASILYAICLWSSGFFLIHSQKESKIRKLITFKNIFYSVLAFATLILLFYWMQSTRYSESGFSLMDSYNSLLVYAVGHLGGFSYWFDWIHSPDELGLGAHSFAGLYEPLGISDWAFAPVQIPKPLWEHLETNVDTAFSELIMDFGTFGSLIVVLVIAFIVTISHRLFIRGVIHATPILAAFYAVAIWSFTTNILNYTSIIFSIFLFSIFLTLRQVKGLRW